MRNDREWLELLMGVGGSNTGSDNELIFPKPRRPARETEYIYSQIVPAVTWLQREADRYTSHFCW